MTWTLAVTGKGGVGKTTLAALAVRLLDEWGKGPVLAVDADPNMCLDGLLGVEVASTVGGVREEAKAIAQAGMSGGVSKHELLDMKIQESLVEAKGFDLIAMGRSEGPGCYCYANNVLRGVLSKLSGQYPAVVIDNEAGLENLSRRTVQQTDWLVFVADPSARGILTARRLYDLSREMEMKAGNMGVVINRLRDEASLVRAEELFAGTPVKVLGGLPEDPEVAAQDASGAPVFSLPKESAAYRAAEGLLRQMVA